MHRAPQLVFPAFTINVLQPRRSLLDADTDLLVPLRWAIAAESPGRYTHGLPAPFRGARVVELGTDARPARRLDRIWVADWLFAGVNPPIDFC
jgi:hypothetical protein